MEQGKTEKRIIEQCMRERLPLPKKIQNAPSLFLGLELFYGAFIDLSTCRPSGWGISAIPWSIMHDYCAANSITGDEREDLFVLVRKMDEAYMEYHNNKNKKNAKIGSNQHGRLGRSGKNNTAARQTSSR